MSLSNGWFGLEMSQMVFSSYLGWSKWSVIFNRCFSRLYSRNSVVNKLEKCREFVSDIIWWSINYGQVFHFMLFLPKVWAAKLGQPLYLHWRAPTKQCGGCWAVSRNAHIYFCVLWKRNHTHKKKDIRHMQSSLTSEDNSNWIIFFFVQQCVFCLLIFVICVHVRPFWDISVIKGYINTFD